MALSVSTPVVYSEVRTSPPYYFIRYWSWRVDVLLSRTSSILYSDSPSTIIGPGVGVTCHGRVSLQTGSSSEMCKIG
jgi:hypothetical protein